MTKPHAAPKMPVASFSFAPIEPTEEEIAKRCRKSRDIREAMFLAKENARLAKKGGQ